MSEAPLFEDRSWNAGPVRSLTPRDVLGKEPDRNRFACGKTLLTESFVKK